MGTTMGPIVFLAPRMRRPRLELPGIPMHITHRGVNRAATFIDDEDCAAYLQALEVAAHMESVAIHAYVLMTNHVDLLVGADLPGAVLRMMQKHSCRGAHSAKRRASPSSI